MITTSVIISTYNRSHSLTKFLESILLLRTDSSFEYEIIIVDNNSTDNTREVVKSYMSSNGKVQYLFESKQGKSNAIKTGIDNSKGEILAFTDDDVLLDKNWLLNIADFSSECDFDALGGKILPLYPENTPQWIKDCKDILHGPIVYHDNGEKIQLYKTGMAPFVGANMVIKRVILEEIGDFNPDLGPGKGSMGEDTDYFYRLRKANKTIFYNPNILIFHPVDKSRMGLKYFSKWYISSGKYEAFKNNEIKDKNPVLVFGAPRHLFREVVILLWKLITSINNKRQFIEAWGGLFTRIGMISAYRCGKQYG